MTIAPKAENNIDRYILLRKYDILPVGYNSIFEIDIRKAIRLCLASVRLAGTAIGAIKKAKNAGSLGHLVAAVLKCHVIGSSPFSWLPLGQRSARAVANSLQR